MLSIRYRGDAYKDKVLVINLLFKHIISNYLRENLSL